MIAKKNDRERRTRDERSGKSYRDLDPFGDNSCGEDAIFFEPKKATIKNKKE